MLIRRAVAMIGFPKGPVRSKSLGMEVRWRAVWVSNFDSLVSGAARGLGSNYLLSAESLFRIWLTLVRHADFTSK